MDSHHGIGVFVTSLEFAPEKVYEIETSEAQETSKGFLKSKSMQRIKQPKAKISSSKGKVKTTELPVIKKDNRSFRETANAVVVKSKIHLTNGIKAASISSSCLAVVKQRTSPTKLLRKGKQDIAITITPCRTARFKASRYEAGTRYPLAEQDPSLESKDCQPRSTAHIRSSSQSLLGLSPEDPYHYLNIAALGNSTAFKDILHSRSVNDSHLISSFDRLLKAKPPIITSSLNTSSRYFELSPLRGPIEFEDVKEPESDWANKRVAMIYSRVAEKTLNYKALMPTWTELSYRKPDHTRMLVVVNFEGVVGTFVLKDSRIILHLRHQAIQALKFLQEYFDVVLMLDGIAARREVICSHLALHNVNLTAVYSYSLSSAKSPLLNYTNIINSVSHHWRPAVIVSASSIAEDHESCSLYTTNGFGSKLNALRLPIADSAEKTPATLIVPHLRSEDPNEVVSAFVFARVLHELAFKTSSSADWRRNFEVLHNGRKPALRCSYTSFLRIFKSDIIHEVFIEMQTPPVSKQECPVASAKRPKFPSSFYGILVCSSFHKSQRGLAEEIEILEEVQPIFQL